jgi:hypothetical protein
LYGSTAGANEVLVPSVRIVSAVSFGFGFGFGFGFSLQRFSSFTSNFKPISFL